MKVCAIYARVSTAEQNPEAQLLELRGYVERRGWKLSGEYVDCISGSKDQRLHLDKLLCACRRRKVDVVLVWALDRLGRSLKHLVMTLDDLSTWGVDFVAYTQPFDTTTPAGKLSFQILAAVAEFEREMLRQRVKAGIARAKAEGKPHGRKKTSIDVEAVRAQLKEGASLASIARTLGVHRSTLYRHLAA